MRKILRSATSQQQVKEESEQAVHTAPSLTAELHSVSAIPVETSAPSLLRDQAALEALTARWQVAPRLALDTEFVRERTYAAELALIQVCDGGEPQLVDPLAGLDLGTFLQCLADPGRTKVLHAARQDLEVLAPLLGGMLTPVLDTQVAGALVGHAPQAGYGELVQKELGITLEKGQARTDWLRRPLSAAQLHYAADDVRHLLPLAGRLLARLGDLGRLAWLAEETTTLASLPLTVNPAEAWQRLKGTESLPLREQARVRALAAWRESRAQRRNLPRSWVLADDALRELARRGARDLEELRQLRLLQDKTLEKLGAEILAALASGDSASLAGLVQRQDTRPTPAEKALAVRLAEVVRTIGSELAMAPEVLATQRDLRILARLSATAGGDLSAVDLPCLRGWRRAVVGERLLAACSD